MVKLYLIRQRWGWSALINLSKNQQTKIATLFYCQWMRSVSTADLKVSSISGRRNTVKWLLTIKAGEKEKENYWFYLTAFFSLTVLKWMCNSKWFKYPIWHCQWRLHRCDRLWAYSKRWAVLFLNLNRSLLEGYWWPIIPTYEWTWRVN